MAPRLLFPALYPEGIRNIPPPDTQFARQFGYAIKLLAISKIGYGRIEARIHPTMIPLKHPLAEVDGVFNAIRLAGDFAGPVMLSGRGAGMDATASAVMGDVMAIARNQLAGGKRRTPALAYRPECIADIPIKAMDDIVGQYYLRFAAIDKPGVLAQISGILGRYDIGIASMIQPERQMGGSVPIVIMTHEAKESNIRQALSEIDALPSIREKSHLIRIESELE